MFNLRAIASAVTVDSAGRPREIRAHGQRLAVTGLESVRDETSAYPLDSGPRTVFVVMTAHRRYRLIHLPRDRRWTVEELPGRGSAIAQAA